MPDVHRFRKDDGTVRLPVDSAQVIEVGDMVFLSTDDVRAASQFTYVTGSLPQTQANFRQSFVGIAMDASASGDTADITIATRGQFEMDVAAAQFEVGDLLGPDDNAGGTALLDQTVIATGENGYGGIMRVTKRYAANTTRVLAEILPEAVRHPDGVITIPLGTHVLGTADELITNLVPQFPFKAVALVSIVTTVMVSGPEVISLDNGATALDDTHSIASGGAVGLVTRTALDDATGDDRFLAGGQLSMSTSGAATSGSAAFYLEVRPFLIES